MKSGVPNFSDIPRHELIRVALDLGIPRPDSLTPEQLREQIQSASAGTKPAPAEGSVSKGLFAVARHLLASVVERGLNLPDAARAIRDTVRPSPRHRPPLPTVTLAQIYLAQGYAERARRTLEQVIEREPDNYKAIELYERLPPDNRRAASDKNTSVDENECADERASPESPVPSSTESTTAGGASEPAPGTVARSSVTPGSAASPNLWFDESERAAALRDALVLVESDVHVGPAAECVKLYWELGAQTQALLHSQPESVEVELACFTPGQALPRRLLLPIHVALGWAKVELLPREVVRGCLRTRQAVLAVGIGVRLRADQPNMPEAFFRPRPRAFYDDVVQRALG